MNDIITGDITGDITRITNNCKKLMQKFGHDMVYFSTFREAAKYIQIDDEAATWDAVCDRLSKNGIAYLEAAAR